MGTPTARNVGPAGSDLNLSQVPVGYWLVGGAFLSLFYHILPPRSADLNPVENLWEILKQDVKGHLTEPAKLTELCTALANIWQVIPVEPFEKLVESMLRRVAAVIKTREGPTCY
ncbi:transposable element Tc3 transposase [Trichonephila clavipes]|nr:transposable element Tc3 transposase [Trichonephila clavipes]